MFTLLRCNRLSIRGGFRPLLHYSTPPTRRLKQKHGSEAGIGLRVREFRFIRKVHLSILLDYLITCKGGEGNLHFSYLFFYYFFFFFP